MESWGIAPWEEEILMSSVIIRGSFAGGTFVPIDETPDVEGPAELIVHSDMGALPETLYHYCG